MITHEIGKICSRNFLSKDNISPTNSGERLQALRSLMFTMLSTPPETRMVVSLVYYYLLF